MTTEERLHFEASYCRAMGLAPRAARRIGVSCDLYEDALQDAAIEVLRQNDDPPADGLLVRAQRHLRWFWRWKRRHEPWEDHKAEILALADTLEADVAAALSLADALAGMTREDRDLLEGVAMGFTMRELATILDLPASTIHDRLQSAWHTLARVLLGAASRKSFAPGDFRPDKEASRCPNTTEDL